jgi:hypothetical protein
VDADDLVGGQVEALEHATDLADGRRFDGHLFGVLSHFAQEWLIADMDPFPIFLLADAHGQRQDFDAISRDLAGIGQERAAIGHNLDLSHTNLELRRYSAEMM